MQYFPPPDHTTEIASGVTGVIITCVVIISLIAYRNWRYEQELDNLLWKIDFREIQLSGANGAKDDQDDSRKQKNTATAKITRVSREKIMPFTFFWSDFSIYATN